MIDYAPQDRPVRGFLIGLAIGLAGITLYSLDVWGQSPTPLGEIKRDAYKQTAEAPATIKSLPQRLPPQQLPAPRIVQQAPVALPVGVRCWYTFIGPDSNTMACNNGFWITRTSDGMVYSGAGAQDPNARQQGSTIAINPATGGPSGYVSAPPGQIPMLSPYEAQRYGYPVQDR